jgi:SOS-response transcriptional repressor LexA
MKNMSKLVQGFGPLPLADRIRNFRKARGWNQSQLADAAGVTQSLVSLWEKGDVRPSATAFAAIARLADDGERTLWISEAGMTQFMQSEDDEPDTRLVPLLRDAAAAGTPRAVDPKAVEMNLKLPRRWLPPGGKLYAIPVTGDSMSPLVNDGYLVIVNVADRKPQELVGRMVAAREGDGITIKWLRRDDGVYFLVPQHTSERHPIRVLGSEGSWSIVGEVVKIIGDPPISTRRK